MFASFIFVGVCVSHDNFIYRKGTSIKIHHKFYLYVFVHTFFTYWLHNLAGANKLNRIVELFTRTFQFQLHHKKIHLKNIDNTMITTLELLWNKPWEWLFSFFKNTQITIWHWARLINFLITSVWLHTCTCTTGAHFKYASSDTFLAIDDDVKNNNKHSSARHHISVANL